jgi:hypothetical protein
MYNYQFDPPFGMQLSGCEVNVQHNTMGNVHPPFLQVCCNAMAIFLRCWGCPAMRASSSVATPTRVTWDAMLKQRNVGGRKSRQTCQVTASVRHRAALTRQCWHQTEKRAGNLARTSPRSLSTLASVDRTCSSIGASNDAGTWPAKR